MPGSFTNYAGSEESSQEIQRTPITGRAGGGVFTAYSSGYPTTLRILAWRIGSPDPIVVARHGSRALSNPGIAADPEGRLWVVWSQNDSNGVPVVFARRSNAEATRFGGVVRARAPKALGDCNSLFSVTPAAQSDVLDVVANFTDGCSGGQVAFWHTQLRPGLTLAARPQTFTRKATVVFTVTDAGDPVAGARVSAGGESATTDEDGKASITLGPYSSARRVKAKATSGGYAPATVTLRVREG
jgi:hypothetical protein